MISETSQLFLKLNINTHNPTVCSASAEVLWRHQVAAGCNCRWKTSQFSDDEGDQVTFVDDRVCVCEADGWVCRRWRSRGKKKLVCEVCFFTSDSNLQEKKKTFHISASDSFRPGRFRREMRRNGRISNVSQFPAKRKTVQVHWWQNCWASTKTLQAFTDAPPAFCL